MKKLLLALSIFFIGSSFINAQSALNFDNTNQWSYVNAGTTFTNNLTGSSSITVEAWISPASLGGFSTVCGTYDGSDMQFLMRLDFGKLAFFISDVAITGVVGTSTLPTGVWTHVAGTWDGTDIKVYVNGVLENTTPKSGSFPNSGHPLIIGNSKITGTEGFDGNIDDLRIWSCAKSQAEISADMNKLHDGSEGMLAYYDFENGTGATLTDLSGNGYTGTLMHTSSGPLPSWVTGKSLTGTPSYTYSTPIGTHTITECDAYTWIDGNTYTTNNNTATFTIFGGASSGCASDFCFEIA